MENNSMNKKSGSHFRLFVRTEKMISKRDRRLHGARGYTLIEILIVLVIASILSAIAIPAMVSQRRLTRFNGLTREFATQIRYARQLAMSERQAMTFQYDDSTKEIKIIDHNNDPLVATSGTAVLANAYPSTAAPAQVVVTVSLLQGGLLSSEISYGVPTTSTGLPSGHPTVPTSLADGTSMTTLASNKINITFQADGSVVSPTGVPVGGVTLSAGTRMDSAIFIFDNEAADGTATAISVLGTSGRVKVWRYNSSANTFSE